MLVGGRTEGKKSVDPWNLDREEDSAVVLMFLLMKNPQMEMGTVVPVIPATQDTEAGERLKPKSLKPA
jgi:hypothetical protein